MRRPTRHIRLRAIFAFAALGIAVKAMPICILGACPAETAVAATQVEAAGCHSMAATEAGQAKKKSTPKSCAHCNLQDQFFQAEKRAVSFTSCGTSGMGEAPFLDAGQFYSLYIGASREVAAFLQPFYLPGQRLPKSESLPTSPVKYHLLHSIWII